MYAYTAPEEEKANIDSSNVPSVSVGARGECVDTCSHESGVIGTTVIKEPNADGIHINNIMCRYIVIRECRSDFITTNLVHKLVMPLHVYCYKGK